MRIQKKKKNNKKKKNFFSFVFLWVIILMSMYLFVSIMYLQVLDFKHLVVGGCLLFVLDIIFICFSKKRKILNYFLVIIYIGCLVFFNFNVRKMTSFLSSLNLNYKTYHYSVVVYDEFSQELKDINGYSFGYYDDGSREVEKALNKVRKKVELEVIPYKDVQLLANDLINGDIDSILLENSYLDILNESIEREGNGFKSLVHKVYDFMILTRTDDVSRDINVLKEPFNVYISGIDTYGEISSVSRSDVNMIVTVNPSTQQILITSIPRDYYVKLYGKSGYRDKLTHAGLYGVDMSIHSLEELLDIEINYYVKVNFSSVVDIVDAIGDVKVYSDYDFTSVDNIHYKKGYNYLNGEEALSFARERKAFLMGDRQRIKNQQYLFSAILDKVMSKEIITKYSRILDAVRGDFVTNMKMERISSLIRLQLSNRYSWNVVINSLSGDDGKDYTYSAPSVKAYVMIPDSSSVSNAHDMIDSVLRGEKLEKVESVLDINKKVN